MSKKHSFAVIGTMKNTNPHLFLRFTEPCKNFTLSLLLMSENIDFK